MTDFEPAVEDSATGSEPDFVCFAAKFDSSDSNSAAGLVTAAVAAVTN